MSRNCLSWEVVRERDKVSAKTVNSRKQDNSDSRVYQNEIILEPSAHESKKVDKYWCVQALAVF